MATGVLSASKSSIFAVQLKLLEGISSEEQLQAAGRLLTQSEYTDVVTERSIVMLCGFPLCRHALPQQFPHKGRYRISLREHKVYDLQETKLFCSTECLVASQTFSTTLASDRDLADVRRAFYLAEYFQKLCISDVQRNYEADDQGNQGQDQCQHVESKILEKKMGICDKVKDTKYAENEGLTIQDDHITGNFKGVWSSGKSIQAPSVSCSDGSDEKLCMKSIECSSVTLKDKDSMPTMLLHEEEVVRINSFETAGPSNAIEGYVPHKERNGRRRNGKAGASKNSFLVHCTKKGYTSTVVDPSDVMFTSSILVDGKPIVEPAQDDHSTMSTMSTQSKKKCHVSWADDNNEKLVNEMVFSSHHGVDTQTVDYLNREEVSRCDEKALDPQNDRMESVEVLVVALTEAAEAVAQGEADSTEAVARAGICIIPSSPDELQNAASVECLQHPAGQLGLDLQKLPEDDIDDEFDSRTCWYSAPPKEFKPELSIFGMLWGAVDGWFSAASVAHVYGRVPLEENEFTYVNGKEYMRQVIIGDGVSAEIERTLAGCISRVLPGLVESFRLPLPVSTLEQALGRLLRTMSLVEAVPPISTKHWRLIVLLLLDALSVYCLPLLRDRLLNSRPQFRKILESSNVTVAEYDIFKDLILPLGRHFEFAAHCGA